MITSPDVLVRNARIFTMNRQIATADAAILRDGLFYWVGSEDHDNVPITGPTQVIDCDGASVVPGFIDAHCHVFSYAAKLVAVDCSPSAVTSITDIIRTIRMRAHSTAPGSWIRATGYSEWDLAEGRHPTRYDLDQAAPGHPVRLVHRSGHACVLNSLALQQTGITYNTEEPRGGVIVRDTDTGEPVGVLLEMDEYLEGRIPKLTETEIMQGIRAADRNFLAAGVTSIQDASINNTSARWDAFQKIKSAGIFSPRIMLMPGIRYLHTFVDRGLRYGSGDENLNIGPVKLMLTAIGGELSPNPTDLREMTTQTEAAGYPLALHAVESQAVKEAVEALAALTAQRTQARELRHRIEHCSECPDDILKILRHSNITVVTNPGFIYESGRRYLATTTNSSLHELYRVRSLLNAGVTVAAGSDTPVTEVPPLTSIYAAVTRRTRNREILGQDEAVTLKEALGMHTLSAAYAGGLESEVGSIMPGRRADFAVLDRDIHAIDPDELLKTTVVKTVIGGQVAWEGPSR